MDAQIGPTDERSRSNGPISTSRPVDGADLHGAARSAPTGAAPTRFGAAGQIWLTLLVVIGTTALAFWRLKDTFFFTTDDWLQFDVAHRSGLGRELLLLNVFNHFAPINRVGHLIMLRYFGLDPDVGAAMAAVLIAALLLVAAWVGYELGLSLIRRLLLIVAVGTSLGLLETAVWNDAAMHILPALLFTYLVVAMHVRAVRTGAVGWHWASVGAFTMGLLTQERAAFALPLIVLIDVLLLWRDVPWSERMRKLWTVKWPLLAMAVIGGIAALLIERDYAAGSPGPGPGLALRAVLMAFTSYQFPQLAGVQPAGPLSGAGQYVVLVAIAVVLVALVGVNRRNLGPVLFYLACFALYWGFLAFSPLLVPDTLIANAERLHNATYLTIPAFLAALSLEGPVRLTQRARPHPGARSVLVGGLVLCVLAAYWTAAGFRYASTSWIWTNGRAAHSFFENARADMAGWTDPAVTVVPLHALPFVAQDWSAPYGRHDFLLPLLAPGWTRGQVTDRTIALDDQGHVRRVAMEPVSLPLSPAVATLPDSAEQSDSGGTCLLRSTGTDALHYEVPAPIPMQPLFAEVSYTSTTAGTVIGQGTIDGIPAEADWPTPIEAGQHTALVALPSGPEVATGSMDSIGIAGIAPGSTFCVNTITAVRPVFVNDDGSCEQIDQYGLPQGVVPCPGPASG